MKLKLSIKGPKDSYLIAVDIRPGVRIDLSNKSNEFCVRQPGKISEGGSLEPSDEVSIEVIE